MRKLLIIGIIIVLLGVAIYFIRKAYLKSKGLDGSTTFSAPNQYTAPVKLAHADDILSLNTYGRQWTTPAAYPVGSDNIVTRLADMNQSQFVDLDIAVEAYAGDFARAFTQASAETFNSSDRTKTYTQLSSKPYWKDLINKINEDPRLHETVKNALLQVLHDAAWNGVLASAASASKKDKFNKAISAVGKYAPTILSAVGL